MANNILSPFLQSAVQAFVSARRSKGGNMQSLAPRRLEHAQRRIVGKLAQGVRKPIKHSTKNIGIPCLTRLCSGSGTVFMYPPRNISCPPPLTLFTLFKGAHEDLYASSDSNPTFFYNFARDFSIFDV